MVGGLIAANSSTILTHLNWGASYLVHDFYRRFIRRDAERSGTTCMAGRLVTVGLFVCSSAVGVSARHGEGRLRHHPADRRRHRAALSGALVLVARERVVRGRRDGQLVRRLGAAPRARARTASTSARTRRCSSRSPSRRSAGWRRPISDRRPIARCSIEFYRKVRPVGPGLGADSRGRRACRSARRLPTTSRSRCSAGSPAARRSGRRSSPSATSSTCGRSPRRSCLRCSSSAASLLASVTRKLWGTVGRAQGSGLKQDLRVCARRFCLSPEP